MPETKENSLTQELAFFEAKQAELLKHYRGQFALIKGRELVGTFTKREEAYAEGVNRFGNVPMLIKQIVPSDEPERIPALMHGLINARP
jgi:hypothetical protein